MLNEIYSLCGYLQENYSCNAYQELKFPIEAYKKFCDLVDLPFPLEEIKPVCREPVKTKVQPVISEKDDNEIEIIEGVTVGDMRKIFNRGAPLDEIVRVLVGHSKLPKEAQTKDQLEKALETSAKKNKWGTGTNNAIANTQKQGVDLLFFPPTKGGRNNTKDYSI